MHRVPPVASQCPIASRQDHKRLAIHVAHQISSLRSAAPAYILCSITEDEFESQTENDYTPLRHRDLGLAAICVMSELKVLGGLLVSREIAPETLLRLYRTMVLIRGAEQRISALFAKNEIPGFIHLSNGQEAIAAGVANALIPGDTFATTHRGHGHAIANGVDLERFLKEILGRAGGLCGGVGGSMHVADRSIGMLGANGIVGAGIPIAVGSSLAHKLAAQHHVAVAFFGDGALAEGVLHESLNIASLWSLPVLFVCENNGWAEFSPTSAQFRSSMPAMAEAFDIRNLRVDGNDVVGVADGARILVDELRAGRGPAALECVTHRHRGHYEGDAQKYRDAAEFETMRNTDPIAVAANALIRFGVPQEIIDAESEAAVEKVDRAVTAALSADFPNINTVSRMVYAETKSG